MLTIWSCSQIHDNRVEKPHNYYDINGLVDEQVKLLESVSPVLLKTAIIDSLEERNEFTPLDSSWSKELEIFKAADINKPTLVGSYSILEQTDSGVKTITYLSKYPAKTIVDSLWIQLDIESKKPLKIHAFLGHNNALFDSEKTLDMVFKNELEGYMISSYKIRGWQKMISKDSSTYFIKGEISNP